MKNPHLISVDELRAAGALDVPAAWRHSLRVERDLFSGFIDDDEEMVSDDQEPAAGDDEESAADDGPLAVPA